MCYLNYFVNACFIVDGRKLELEHQWKLYVYEGTEYL